MIIAIDGPAASGKGTLAQLLANEYNLQLVDTGKLYRFLAYALDQRNIILEKEEDLDDEKRAIIQEICVGIAPEELKQHVLRDEKVGKKASKISKIAFIRESLIPVQHYLVKKLPHGSKGAVLDGRDIGTVVFPEADYKFFLDASLEKRAERRFHELHGKYSLEEVTAMIAARDSEDESRALAPLKPAKDAILIDNSVMGIQKMFEVARGHIFFND